MHVERVLSLNNGWDILSSKPQEWQEVQKPLSLISDEVFRKGLASLEEGEDGAYFISFFLYVMYASEMADLLKTKENVVELPVNVRAKRYASHEIGKFSFNGIYATMIGIDDLSVEDLVNSLYISIPKYHEQYSVEVSVIFVPSAAMVQHYANLGATPSQLAHIPTEEFCRTQAAKFIATSNKIPVVFAFLSPTAPSEITVEELSTVTVGGHTIERTIEFAPEYYQAGVSLLSYFGEVLRQKDPNTKAKVHIEQDGRIVRLHIESSSGDIETIEKELEQYALVISNQAPPETLFENRMHIMQLESKLEVAKVELKNAHDLKQLTDGFYSQQIRDLKQQVDSLTQQIVTQVLHQGKFIELVAEQTGSHERIATALIGYSQGLFKDLLHEASGNQQLSEAVRSLQNNLLSGITTVDIEDQLARALSTIKQEKPGFLGRMATEFKGAAYKAGASSGIAWVTKWIAAH